MNLLTRHESAKHLRVGVRAFDEHVRPSLTPVRIGRRLLFDEADLDAWADTRKAGSSDSPKVARPTSSASRTTAAPSIGPLGLKIRDKLRKRRLASTLNSSSESLPESSSFAAVIPLRSRTL